MQNNRYLSFPTPQQEAVVMENEDEKNLHDSERKRAKVAPPSFPAFASLSSLASFSPYHTLSSATPTVTQVHPITPLQPRANLDNSALPSSLSYQFATPINQQNLGYQQPPELLHIPSLITHTPANLSSGSQPTGSNLSSNAHTNSLAQPVTLINSSVPSIDTRQLMNQATHPLDAHSKALPSLMPNYNNPLLMNPYLYLNPATNALVQPSLAIMPMPQHPSLLTATSPMTLTRTTTSSYSTGHFVLQEQPSTRQRKSYKNEHRYSHDTIIKGECSQFRIRLQVSSSEPVACCAKRALPR
jgi:hypothetical protein